MKATGIATTITMLAAVAITAKPAVAGPPFPERCCACLPSDARTSGSVQSALACATILTQEQLLQFQNQCSDLGGDGLCIAPVTPIAVAATQGDNIDCTALFAAEEIVCPGLGRTAPVPVLGTSMLAGLALGLGGLGVFARRRPRR